MRIRKFFAALIVMSTLVVAVTGGLLEAFYWFAGAGFFFWVWITLWDFITVANTDPRSEIHVHLERHADPTRPDEHPLIILHESDYRRAKKK